SLSGLALGLVALAMSIIGRGRGRGDRAALAGRLDALAARVARLEARLADRERRAEGVRPRTGAGPMNRVDRPPPDPVPGPTLISVPNLAAPAEGGGVGRGRRGARAAVRHDLGTRRRRGLRRV